MRRVNASGSGTGTVLAWSTMGATQGSDGSLLAAIGEGATLSGAAELIAGDEPAGPPEEAAEEAAGPSEEAAGPTDEAAPCEIGLVGCLPQAASSKSARTAALVGVRTGRFAFTSGGRNGGRPGCTGRG